MTSGRRAPRGARLGAAPGAGLVAGLVWLVAASLLATSLLAASVSVTSVSLASVSVASAQAAATTGQGTPAQRRACTPDVYRLCRVYIPNADAITQCLKRNLRALNPQCRAVFQGKLR